MKEITRIEKVYDFNKLSESAKENARTKYCESFREAFIFSGSCEEKLKEDFPHSDLKVEYSLSYCQGDGLNIYGIIAISDLIKQVKQDEDIIGQFDKEEKRFIDYLEKQDIEIKFDSNGRYSYYTDKTEDIKYYIECDLEYQYFRSIPYTTIEKFAKFANRYLKGYCKKMEDDGYSFFYEVDDEEIEETWDANEYLGWSEDGKPVYC